MKIIVTGSHTHANVGFIRRWLDRFHARNPITLLIHGGALHVDSAAGKWAEDRGVRCHRCRAQWSRYGRSAGPKRNAEMLLIRPDVVVAFPGSIGTADMVTQARSAGVTVIEVSYEEDNLP